MNTKLHKKFFLSVLTLVFIGLQTVSAQYQGVPFTSIFPKVDPIQIGKTVGVGDLIQMEYFDTMTYTDGSPDNLGGANNGNQDPEAGNGGTYFDKNAAGDETSAAERSTFRSGSEVDLVDRANADSTIRTVITANQGQEYQIYTVEVLQTGMYTAKLHYSHTSPNPKRFQIYIYEDPTSLSSGKVVLNTQADNPAAFPQSYNIDLDVEPYAYIDSEECDEFSLTKGTVLIRARSVDGGWQTDYMTFTLKSAATASVDDEALASNSLKAFPNPANDGKFQLNIESDWSVFSVLGTKVIEGKGKNIDLSSFAKGLYVLKTAKETKRLIYK